MSEREANGEERYMPTTTEWEALLHRIAVVEEDIARLSAWTGTAAHGWRDKTIPAGAQRIRPYGA